MYFRNLTIFRFPAAVAEAIRGLQDTEGGADAWLEEHRAKPCGPLEMFSRGFVSPFGREGATLAHQVGSCIWLTLGGEDKILPGSVVNAEVARRAALIEEAEGRKLGGRARRALKDEVLQHLLPRALTKPYRLNAYLDLARGLLVVDTASRKAADSVAFQLRQALGSFPALPLNAEVAPRSVLTGWLAGDDLPEGAYDGDVPVGPGFLSIGDEATLADPVDGGATATLKRQELACEEVAKHLEAGKQCARLGLVLDNHVAFAFGDDLVVRKVRLLAGAVEGLEETDRDGVEAELDARFALMTGELGPLFDVLERAFKLSKPAEAAP